MGRTDRLRAGAPRRMQAARAPPGSGAPPTVRVAPAERHDVPIVREYVGTLDGYVNVELRARVAGFLEAQHYREGTVVEQGQLLFTMNPRQYQAALSQAKAALARAKATLTNAQVTVRRLRPLAEQRAVSTRRTSTPRWPDSRRPRRACSPRGPASSRRGSTSRTRGSPRRSRASPAPPRSGSATSSARARRRG